MKNPLFAGFHGFVVMWLGQFASLLGTAMTRFALTIWAYQETGSATALALVGFFSFGPVVLLSPIAGALVDRWPRKHVLILSDLGAGVATLTLLFLVLTDNLALWHLYAAGAIAGAFESCQFPAFSASITTMVDKAHYARTSAMRGVAESASTIVAPLLAGLLLARIGLVGILLIDAVTFLVAVGALALISIPPVARPDAGDAAEAGLRQEILYGFRYIWRRPSLLGIQLVFTFSNLLAMLGLVLLAPMVLAITNDEVALGAVQTAAGVGGLVGGVLLSIWGGPRRKVHGVLIGMMFNGLLGQALIGLGGALWVWVTGSFLTMFFVPIINSSNQAIWQSKVAPGVQGRVFAVRRLIAQITAPVAMLLAGPLADQLFEPAMRPGGALAPFLAGLFGAGPGAGIRLIFVLTGFLAMIVGALGYAFPVVRDIETILADHDASAPQQETFPAAPGAQESAAAGAGD